MKQTIWTAAYSPFIMGGDVNAPIATEVEVGDPIDLGGGIKGFVVVSPKGRIHVAEASTGAFVGTDVDKVKADIAAGDPAVMKKQLAEAKEQFKNANHLEPEAFWGRFR